MKLGEKIEIDTKMGKSLRDSAEGFMADVRDFSLSFLPEKTQTHLLNMSKEAFLTAHSLVSNGLGMLDKKK